MKLLLRITDLEDALETETVEVKKLLDQADRDRKQISDLIDQTVCDRKQILDLIEEREDFRKHIRSIGVRVDDLELQRSMSPNRITTDEIVERYSQALIRRERQIETLGKQLAEIRQIVEVRPTE